MLVSFSVVSIVASSLAFVAAADTTITPAPTPTVAKRQSGSTPSPLTDYTYAYSAVPYKVNPYAYLRGPQSGYNQCNSTTEGPDAMCQTLILNSINDFCLWGAPGSGSSSNTSALETVGDVEAAMVAFCSSAGHGSRIIPAGAIQGVQFMRTSQYVQIVGFVDQTALGLQADDTGGEEDPHGADELGNPLGSLVYSDGLPGGDNSTLQQVVSWNYFIGSGTFCFKLCSPTADKNYCQNKYDLLGCSYNMPADYASINGTYQSCEGELQDVVGTYTDASGATQTWSQPESLAADTTLPWTPRVPSSSNCVTYQSSELYPLASLGYLASSASSMTASASASDSALAQATGSNSSGGRGASSASRSGSGAASPSQSSSSSSPTSGATRNVGADTGDLWFVGFAASVAMALIGGAVVLA